LVPRPLTTAIMATEMPAAIRPYSIAVAPDSHFMNARSLLIIAFTPINSGGLIGIVNDPDKYPVNSDASNYS